METMRVSTLHANDDDDPYSFVPRAQSSGEKSVRCFGERVLFETWGLKRSRWLKQWRMRWIVLTHSSLQSFRSLQGYTLGEQPTEAFEVHPLQTGSVRVLQEEVELREAEVHHLLPGRAIVGV